MTSDPLQGPGVETRAAIARAASVQPPDFVNFTIVPTRFDTKALARVRLNLPKAAHHLIDVVRDHHDLAVGDANELVGIRRLRIPTRFFVDFTGKLTIAILDSAGARH